MDLDSKLRSTFALAKVSQNKNFNLIPLNRGQVKKQVIKQQVLYQ